jgi:hypothetical protein
MQPTVLWAQRDDFVWLTVDLANAEDIKVDLTSSSLKFNCKADGKDYSFDLEFFKPVNKDDSKFLKHRLIDFALKKEAEEDWPRLTLENKKLPWLKVDWSKWQESDAEDEPQGFDMSNMGGFGDMGFGAEMAGLGGMGGADFSQFAGDDSDDEDELPDLPEESETSPKDADKAPLIQEMN